MTEEISVLMNAQDISEHPSYKLGLKDGYILACNDMRQVVETSQVTLAEIIGAMIKVQELKQ